MAKLLRVRAVFNCICCAERVRIDVEHDGDPLDDAQYLPEGWALIAELAIGRRLAACPSCVQSVLASLLGVLVVVAAARRAA